jgi:hypothetical protein
MPRSFLHFLHFLHRYIPITRQQLNSALKWRTRTELHDGCDVTDRSSISAVDFLRRSLADGALAVGVLETQARAAGLLGESQQIQHAKAFKRAKKALGIRSLRNGFGSSGKWAWLMPPQAATEIAPVANAPLHTNEQTSLSDAELPGKRVAASGTPSIVQQWIEGVERLDYVRSPTAVPLIRWHLFLGDCHRFLNSSENWAERAAAHGWNALALFGCHWTRPLEHLGSAGLLWAINGGKLVELHRDWAVIERAEDRSRQIHHRRSPHSPNVALPWGGAHDVPSAPFR